MFSQEILSLRARLADVEKMRLHLIESISALERAQAHFQKPHAVQSGSETEFLDGERLTQRGAIRQAIGVLSGEFSSRDVGQYLRDFHPAIHATLKPQVLSNVLYKFAREGLIRQVRQGARGRPSVFIGTNSKSSSAESRDETADSKPDSTSQV